MSSWIDFLISNPVLALAMVIVLVLFIFMVIRKLLKWAVLSFVVLVIAVAWTYQGAQKTKLVEEINEKAEELKQHVEEIIDDPKDLKKDLEKATEKVIDEIHKSIDDN